MGEPGRDLFDVDFGPGLVSFASALLVDHGRVSESGLVDLIGLVHEFVGWAQAREAELVAELAARRGGPTDEAAATAAALAVIEAQDDASSGRGWRSGREPRPRFWEANVLGPRLGLSSWDARRLVATSVALCATKAAAGPGADGTDSGDPDEAPAPVSSGSSTPQLEVRLGSRLGRARAELDAGRLGWKHVDVLEKATARLTDEQAASVEERVLADRNVRTWQQVQRRATALAAEIDPPAEVPGRAGRRLAVRETVEGSVELFGALDAEGGRVVAGAVEAYGTPTGPDDDRTIAERWADALVEICRLALDGLDGSRPSRRQALSPHLTLLATAGTCSTAPGLAQAGTVTLTAGSRLGPLDLTPGQAQRPCCDATVEIAHVTDDGLIGQVAQRWRRLPGHRIRRQLALRDKGCRFPGCHRPANRCRPHHVVYWSRGGQTVLSNLVLLCDEHHRAVHDDGWTLTFDGTTATFADPFGRSFESPPPLAPPDPWRPPEPLERLLQPYQEVWREPAVERDSPLQHVGAVDERPPF